MGEDKFHILPKDSFNVKILQPPENEDIKAVIGAPPTLAFELP
jgi:hypothetical protein